MGEWGREHISRVVWYYHIRQAIMRAVVTMATCTKIPLFQSVVLWNFCNLNVVHYI